MKLLFITFGFGLGVTPKLLLVTLSCKSETSASDQRHNSSYVKWNLLRFDITEMALFSYVLLFASNPCGRLLLYGAENSSV